MNICASKITNWLIKNGAIVPSDRELYEYALYSMGITIAPLFLVLIIGAFMGALMEGIILIIPFMLIRKFSGGYHAKSAVVCFFCSCMLLVMCISVASHIEYSIWFSVFTIVAVISLAIFSPIDSENRRLEQEEIGMYKNITIKLALLCMVLHFILLFGNLKRIAVCISIGLLLSAGLQLPCIIKSVCKKMSTKA